MHKIYSRIVFLESIIHHAYYLRMMITRERTSIVIVKSYLIIKDNCLRVFSVMYFTHYKSLLCILCVYVFLLHYIFIIELALCKFKHCMTYLTDIKSYLIIKDDCLRVFSVMYFTHYIFV